MYVHARIGAMLAVLATLVACSSPPPGPISVVSASPSATAATTPAASPATAPPSILSDRFGFVWVREPTNSVVGAESGGVQVEFPGLSYRFSNCSCAVSPDGGRIAYWTTRITPDSSELRVLDLARGMTTTTYKPPRERRISHAAWSSDGTGVVFSMEGVKQPGEPVGDPPNLSLLVIDASGGDPRTLDQNAGVYVPLGWDRAAGVAAAIITGEGGYMTGYVTARTSGDPAPVRSRVDASIFSFSVDVSSDQRYALGTFWKEGQPGATLRWWRLTDFSAMTVGPRLDQERPRWRPGTAEIAWVSGSALRLLDIGSGATRDIAIFPGADYRVEAFRHDGSAVVGVGTGGRRLFQIASGRGEPLPGSGQIAGAVRLR